MTVIDHARPRPSSRRSRLTHAPRVELASQGVIATYVRDISRHRPRRALNSERGTRAIGRGHAP
jgi:hypothetical protein